MKSLYLECKMGASGNMLMSAIYELLSSEDQLHFCKIMNQLIPGITIVPQSRTSCGVSGTYMEYIFAENAEQHIYENFSQRLDAIIDHSALPVNVRNNTKAIYCRISSALACVDSTCSPNTNHNTGELLRSVIEVAGVCLAIDMLNPASIAASPVHLGNGLISTPHGRIPVPSPVTVKLLNGIPCYCGDIEGELCTSAGAALLAHFCKDFCAMPPMALLASGCGIGEMQYIAANCVRAFWGERKAQCAPSIVELCCHIDDMTAEALAYASESLLKQGALDVTSAPLVMKKGRSGILFTVLCRPDDEERIAHAILRETSTSGIRVRHCSKYILTPSSRTIKTKYGPIRIKCADGYGIHHEKPEYEDVANAARHAMIPFQDVWQDVLNDAQTDSF